MECIKLILDYLFNASNLVNFFTRSSLIPWTIDSYVKLTTGSVSATGNFFPCVVGMMRCCTGLCFEGMVVILQCLSFLLLYKILTDTTALTLTLMELWCKTFGSSPKRLGNKYHLLFRLLNLTLLMKWSKWHKERKQCGRSWQEWQEWSDILHRLLNTSKTINFYLIEVLKRWGSNSLNIWSQTDSG